MASVGTLRTFGAPAPLIPVVSFLVCAAGVITSLLQTGMAAGAKFWQERWEYDVELIEKRLLAALPEDGDRTETYELFSKSIDRSEQIVHERLSPRKFTDRLRQR